MKKHQKRLIDLIVVILIILFSIPLIIQFQVRPLVSAIYFFLIPSIYLLSWKPRKIHRVLASSFLFGVIFGFVFDFLAVFNRAWFVPDNQLVFKFRILGLVPLDETLWFVLWIIFIIVFYEHFLERNASDTISPSYKHALIPSLFAIVAILFIYIYYPHFLKINYAYLVFGICAMLPFLYLISKKPAMIINFLKVSLFFVFVFLAYELLAVKLGQWNFPGHYVGTIKIFALEFPFEEFFFWVLISSSVILSYYELYVDNSANKTSW